MKSPLKIFQRHNTFPMFYENDEEAKIAEHNWDGAENDCQDSSNENALVENYSSSKRLEKKDDGESNHEWCS